MIGFIILALRAEAVTLTWPANADPSVAGYKLYSGVTADGYTEVLDTGTATSAYLPLVPGTYYFSVAAYYANGAEGNFSIPLVLCVPSGSFTTWITYGMQNSLDDVSWTDFGSLAVANENPARFFRLVPDSHIGRDVVRIEQSANYFWFTCATWTFPYSDSQSNYLRLQP